MNAFDILIIIIFAYCFIRGIFRGLIKEAAGIVGVLAGFYGAYTYYPVLSRILGRWISEASYSHITSFFIIFSVVFILVSIVGVVIRYLMNIAFLGWLDRLLGSVLGFFKALLITSVILVALTAFLPKDTPVLIKSKLAPKVSVLSENLAKVVKNEMKKEYIAKIKALKKSWNLHQ
jgi:membrane protein required for colicin V production